MSRCRPTRAVAGFLALFIRPRAFVLALGAALATTIALAPFAHASVVWSPPQDLTPSGQHNGGQKVAVDSQGRATVVWQHFDGTNSRIRELRIAADGTPGAVHTLSTPDQGAHNVQVAVDSLGRATVVWYLFNQTRGRIQEVRIRANGTPGAVHSVSAAGQPAQNPQVAIDSQDRATVVWQRYDGTNTRVQAARIVADGTPGAVHTLSATGVDAHDVQVGIDPHDRATVVWQATDFSVPSAGIQAVRIRADGTPGMVRDLSSAAGQADTPKVAVDSRGVATVAWNFFNGTRYRVQSRRINANGTLGAVHYLSPAGRQAALPVGGTAIASDSSDRTTVVWQGNDGSNTRIQAVRIARSGTPGAVQNLSAAGRNSRDPALAVDPPGRATVVWSGSDGAILRAQAVRIRVDGTRGAEQMLSAAGGFAFSPQVAAGSQGRATAVWQLRGADDDVVQWVRAIPNQ